MTMIGENEIISSREFDVPRELVFRAWTTPDLLAQWWGPQGFTNTFHECDMRPEGTWKFTMHGPNGVDYPNHNVFVEIVPPEQIVLDHLSGHEFRVTATFDDLEGRTKVTFRQNFKKKEAFEHAKPICIEANEQQLDRLGKVLAEMES
ncbi:SRPBCC family protein [Paenibacillus terrigena]|uniref:SRPBCC family protein n=1 Tax=Paenibacillus terrigena TaxID=369333 RepID=UPI0028D33050|nr:SRPBCC family protein [Paenibacillus terrigena]